MLTIPPFPCLSAALCLASFAQPPAQDGPPGLVPVEGGRTTIGSKVDEVVPIIQSREELASALAGETPQFSAEVADFLLMPTEVTNEQYAAFVYSSGARPPRSWGAEALEGARLAFLEDQGRRAREAKEQGQLFERAEFDPEAWWQEHWRDGRWSVPGDLLEHPVVNVSYADAQRYARWAGLRLMSELEFERAARGDSARSYPWGDQWDDRRFCQSLHAGKDQTEPVGSFPEGAVGGLFDLAGNVWEWTSSPYDPFPGYKPFNVQVGGGPRKRTIEALAGFDSDERVVVGGSFQVDRVGVRTTTRKDSLRDQSTNALGFRCAASPTSGLDASRWILEQDLWLGALGRAELAPTQTVALRRWTTMPGQVRVPGYAVISGYQHALFCPVRDAPASVVADLAERTVKEGPLFLGFVDLTFPMVEPELDGRTYLVAWRAAGKLQEQGAGRPSGQKKEGQVFSRTSGARQGQIDLADVPGFDAGRDCYIFHDARGEPLVAIPAPEIKSERWKPCALKLEPLASDPRAQRGAPAAPLDTLRFTIAIPSASQRAKAFVFDLPIKAKPGTVDASWK